MVTLTNVTHRDPDILSGSQCLLVPAFLSDRCSITLKVATASMSFFTSFHR